MNALWDAYWPVLVAAAIIGLNAGAFAFRKQAARQTQNGAASRRGALILCAGVALTLAFGALWHGPLGSGDGFAAAVEKQSRRTLIDFEMTQIQAGLERDPLRRTVVLSGPADDFQRSELVRIIGAVPGVASVRWADMPQPGRVPLLAEVELGGLAGFGLGLLLAYLLELRRRSRAQWRW
jgi:hypothetical protein